MGLSLSESIFSMPLEFYSGPPINRSGQRMWQPCYLDKGKVYVKALSVRTLGLLYKIN